MSVPPEHERPAPPGDDRAAERRRRPTIRHVAALAGVGIKTVSRVINGEPGVSPATLLRVTQAARHLNYVPDPHARNLKRLDGRSQTLGLLAGNVSTPFWAEMHRAIEDAAAERRVAVFASSLDDDPERECRAVSSFLRRRVDGLILATITPSQAYLRPEQTRGTPLVFVDRMPRGLEADAVRSDNEEGAAQATRHLLEHGHRRIAFLGDRDEIDTALRRRTGFLAAMERSGHAGEAVVAADLADEEASRQAVLALLAAPNPPTALFTGHSRVTVGALRALRERGLERTVALVGFDDIPLGDLRDPGVTVVAQNPEAIGRAAVTRVFERLDGDSSPAATIVVPTRLITRGSGEIRPPEAPCGKV